MRGRTDTRTHGRTNEQTHGLTDARTHIRMDARMHKGKHPRTSSVFIIPFYNLKKPCPLLTFQTFSPFQWAMCYVSLSLSLLTFCFCRQLKPTSILPPPTKCRLRLSANAPLNTVLMLTFWSKKHFLRGLKWAHNCYMWEKLSMPVAGWHDLIRINQFRLSFTEKVPTPPPYPPITDRFICSPTWIVVIWIHLLLAPFPCFVHSYCMESKKFLVENSV